METQKAFSKGDFATAVKCGEAALTLARLMPESARTMECIQIHLNMTTAHLQLKNSDESQRHSKVSVELAEKGMIMRPGDSHAVEMFAVALGSRTNVLINENQLDEAEKHGMRALSLAEKMFGPNDPRLFKYLRAVGITREKQDKVDEAIKLLTRAFDLVFEHLGPLHGDTQTVADELVNLHMRRCDDSDKEKALATSRKCYELGLKALAAETADKRQAEGSLGDSAARVGTVLAKLDREAEAEPFMRTALALREKVLGENHPAVAVSLGYMAGILEGQGNFGDETEAFIVRSMNIFKELEGPNGQHVRSSMVHLQRIRMKREALLAGAGSNNDDDDDDDDADKAADASKTGTSKPASAVVTTKKAVGSTAVTKGKGKTAVPDIEFAADDGVGRMQHATMCFQMQEFSRAEILLAQAFDIFLRENGPSHASTAAARQNLEVVRANAINKLWQEVAKDEILALAATDSSGASAPSSPDRSRASNGTSGLASESTKSVAASGKGAAAAQQEEVTWCKPQKVSADDEWLFRDAPKGGLSECTIC
jgi:tetratricopeptide (TPR) repeat protein